MHHDLADQFRTTLPKLAKMMDAAEHEVLSYMAFPRAHWLQIHSSNPLERLNAEIKRRTNVVGIFPNDASITRLVGAMLLEQSGAWSLNRRYMQLEGLQSLSAEPLHPRIGTLSGIAELHRSTGRDLRTASQAQHSAVHPGPSLSRVAQVDVRIPLPLLKLAWPVGALGSKYAWS